MLHPVLAAERRAVIALLAGSSARLAELLPQVERDAEVEALHQFRVELRRVRTVIKALAPELPLADTDALIEECRWLAGRGSGLRDCDVLMHRLEEYLGESLAADSQALRRLRRELGALRSRERRGLLAAVRGRRTHRLLERLGEAAEVSLHAAGWPARAGVVRALRRALARVTEFGAALDPESPAEALHELRKRCKRLRYLLEMYQQADRHEEFVVLLKRLRKLQNAFGDFQDFTTHAALLLRLRQEAQGAPAEGAYLALLDRLQEALRERSAEARASAGERFRDLDRSAKRKRVRRLLKSRRRLQHPQIGTGGYCHGMRDDAPAALPVGKVVCVGRNYAAHAAELGNPVPEQPLLFIKPPSAVVDLAPQLRVPTTAGSVHHELEIALLIGRELCCATPERARRAVAGIGLGIDLTLRELQDRLKARAHPWEVSKGFDGACALSPFAPLDPALDLAALTLRLVVNGRRRQFGSSAQMLTPIIELLCFASARFTLWPGDVVLTGTPAGVGPLVPGDRLLAELGGILQLRSIVTG